MLLALLLAPAVAFSGQAEAKRAHYCQLLENAFVTAASTRDNGMSPKQSYNVLMGSVGSAKDDAIPSAKIKKVINLVYFDPRFTYAGGPPLGEQVFNSCMGRKQYKPLR